jgi:hypothetical protein
MARFQTYLDNTFSKPPGSAPVPSFSTPASPDSSRLPVPIVPEYGLSGQRNPYYHKSMPEVYNIIYVYIYMYIYVYVYIYIYIYKYMDMHIHIYINIHNQIILSYLFVTNLHVNMHMLSSFNL